MKQCEYKVQYGDVVPIDDSHSCKIIIPDNHKYCSTHRLEIIGALQKTIHNKEQHLESLKKRLKVLQAQH